MALYSYVALDQRGQEQSGELEAASPREAATALRNQAVYVVSVTAGGGGAGSGRRRGWRGWLELLSLRRYLPVRPLDLVFLFHQLALMLRSGHTVVQALDANREMASKLRLRQALGALSHDIQGGASLSRSMAAQKGLFPPQVSKLLEAGERSGEIDNILDRLAEDLERRQDVKRQLTTALTYPAIVFFMALGVSIALVGWVIPRFAGFLSSRGVDLPPITRFLLDLATWFETWGGTVGATLLLALLAVFIAATTHRGARLMDAVLVRTPVIGKVILASGLAQATWTMAMQLRSGISLLASLRITRDVTSNRALGEAFGQAGDEILSGRPLSAALRRPPIPQLVSHMAAIGERSGELDAVMESLGEFYRKDLQARVKALAAWVEPLLILIVGGMVAVVYLAFFQAALKVSTGGM